MSTPLSPINLAVGAAVGLFEVVSTLGQPLEVLKTHLAANRTDTLRGALRATYARGGVLGFYQGLIPWAWIESSTAGAILVFTSSYVESAGAQLGLSKGVAGLWGGIAGGVAQAYLVMGVCTTMKTAEITREKLIRHKSTVVGEPGAPAKVPSTFKLFADMYKNGGIAAVNKGVNAVALRQATNWGSRMGIARLAESAIKDARGLGVEQKLDTVDKVLASSIGGVLGAWNHPVEVVRVEMQSLKPGVEGRPAKLTMKSTARYIYSESGLKGFFKGVTPRIGLSVWRTVCLVSLSDYVKEAIEKRSTGAGGEANKPE